MSRRELEGRVLNISNRLNVIMDNSRLGDLEPLVRLKYQSLAMLITLLCRGNHVAHDPEPPAAPTKHRRLIAVLGMHRSGTSMVAGVLARLGVHLGPEDDLIAPDDNNRLGYFENRYLVGLDRLLLFRAGGSSTTPPARERIRHQGAMAERGVRSLLQRFDGRRMWAVKDPRMCLTGWVLFPALVKLRDDVRLVVVSRDRDAAVRSMVRRDGLSLSRAEKLARHYLGELEDLQASFRLPTLRVRYEQFFDREADPLAELCAFVGPPQSPEAVARARAFVREDLRHF